jgi:hypothetical protein
MEHKLFVLIQKITLLNLQTEHWINKILLFLSARLLQKHIFRLDYSSSLDYSIIPPMRNGSSSSSDQLKPAFRTTNGTPLRQIPNQE